MLKEHTHNLQKTRKATFILSFHKSWKIFPSSKEQAYQVSHENTRSWIVSTHSRAAVSFTFEGEKVKKKDWGRVGGLTVFWVGQIRKSICLWVCYADSLWVGAQWHCCFFLTIFKKTTTENGVTRSKMWFTLNFYQNTEVLYKKSLHVWNWQTAQKTMPTHSGFF